MFYRSLTSSYSATSVRHSILCSLILLMSSSVTALAEQFCPENYWWDHERDDCIRCTVCDDQSIVLRPCQPHQDVVCGTLSDLEYDLNWLAAVGAPKQRVSPKRTELLFTISRCCRSPSMNEQQQKINSILILFTRWNAFSQSQASTSNHNLRVIEKSSVEMILSDWHTLALALAACACVLFFIVAACLFWQHTRYWKKMERMEREYNAGLWQSVHMNRSLIVAALNLGPRQPSVCRAATKCAREEKNCTASEWSEDRLTEIQSSTQFVHSLVVMLRISRSDGWESVRRALLSAAALLSLLLQ